MHGKLPPRVVLQSKTAWGPICRAAARSFAKRIGGAEIAGVKFLRIPQEKKGGTLL